MLERAGLANHILGFTMLNKNKGYIILIIYLAHTKTEKNSDPVFLCPCVGPIPLVELTLTWFAWVENSTSPYPTIVKDGAY